MDKNKIILTILALASISILEAMHGYGNPPRVPRKPVLGQRMQQITEACVQNVANPTYDWSVADVFTLIYANRNAGLERALRAGEPIIDPAHGTHARAYALHRHNNQAVALINQYHPAIPMQLNPLDQDPIPPAGLLN